MHNFSEKWCDNYILKSIHILTSNFRDFQIFLIFHTISSLYLSYQISSILYLCLFTSSPLPLVLSSWPSILNHTKQNCIFPSFGLKIFCTISSSFYHFLSRCTMLLLFLFPFRAKTTQVLRYFSFDFFLKNQFSFFISRK